MKNKYYDGTKLLSMLDINGNKPEIYMCTTNRTGGKTTYFGRLLINRYLDKGEKFCLIYRYNYELDDVAEKFFKDLNTLFFPEYEMISRRRANGIFHELFFLRPRTTRPFSARRAHPPMTDRDNAQSMRDMCTPCGKERRVRFGNECDLSAG